MAIVNPNKPAGLAAVKHILGNSMVGQGNMYTVLAADTNPYFIGDLVDLTGIGDSRGIPGITLATAGNPAVGVIAAIGVNPDGGPYVNINNLALVNRPTGAQPVNYYALVMDDPYLIFEIQEGGAGTNLTTAFVGKNANILYAAPAAGVAVSGTTFNNATTATTATLNLKLLGLVRRADNAFTTSPTTGGGAQKWWCTINNHRYKAGVAGI
jgi:hypothetical protein